MLSLYELLFQRRWATDLEIALALFDIVGEFIDQGLLTIVITVSFVVATAILILAFIYDREVRYTAR